MDAFLNLEGGIHFVLDWILRQMRGRLSVIFVSCGGSGGRARPACLPHNGCAAFINCKDIGGRRAEG